MRRKKIILLIIFAFCLLFTTKVDAKVICEYGSYRLEFSGSGQFSKLYINDDVSDKDIDIDFKISNKEECPNKIYIGVLDLGWFEYPSIIVRRDKNMISTFNSISELDLTNSYDGKVSCGNITGIPAKIPQLVSEIITIIQIAIPVILVIMGTLDLFKGVTAQKDDEIKKGQQMFIKRLIVAALIFFIVVIVKFLISIVAETTSANIIECIDCFISNDCK